MTEKTHFNSNQVRIVQFFQKELQDPETMGAPKTVTSRNTSIPQHLYEYSVSLKLPEAWIENLKITGLRLEAEGARMESMTQKEMVGLMLDMMIEAIQREKSGIRPGMKALPPQNN